MSKKIPHIHIVVAQDDFLITESVNAIIESMEDVEISKYDYISEDFHLVLDKLRSYSLFGTKQLIVLQKANKLTSEDQQLIANLPDINYLIIEVQLKAQEAQKKFKKLSHFICNTSNIVYNNQLPQWIQARFRKYGGNITHEASLTLIKFTGNQLAVIDNELKNLKLFAGDKIDVNNVKDLIDRTAESDVFELVEAVAIQDRTKALSNLWKELQNGTEPIAMVAILASHFMRLLDFKKSQKKPNGFYQEKLSRQANSFSKCALEDIIKHLTHTDRLIKTQPTTELIMEQLIINITTERNLTYGVRK